MIVLFHLCLCKAIFFSNYKISEYEIAQTSHTSFAHIPWIFILSDTKLKKLEVALKKKFDANGEESLETKLLEYQKKYESQKKAELKIEV